MQQTTKPMKFYKLSWHHCSINCARCACALIQFHLEALSIHVISFRPLTRGLCCAHCLTWCIGPRWPETGWCAHAGLQESMTAHSSMPCSVRMPWSLNASKLLLNALAAVTWVHKTKQTQSNWRAQLFIQATQDMSWTGNMVVTWSQSGMKRSIQTWGTLSTQVVRIVNYSVFRPIHASSFGLLSQLLAEYCSVNCCLSRWFWLVPQ